MNDEFVGEFIAFKGDDEYVDRRNILIEITNVEEGSVEVALTVPLPGSPRIYLSFPFNELCDRVARWSDEK